MILFVPCPFKIFYIFYFVKIFCLIYLYLNVYFFVKYKCVPCVNKLL